MTSDFELKAGKFADGLAHAQQAIKLNDKTGPYYILASANALGDQQLDRAREYCELILKGGEKEFGSTAVNDARTLQDQLIKKTYTLTFNLDTRKGLKTGNTFAIAMAKTGLPNQSATYEINGAQSHRLVKGDANDVLHVVPMGNNPITLSMKVTVQPYSYKKDLTKPGTGALPADARAQLGPFTTVNPKSPVLTKTVAGLKGSNNVETARNILDWMKKNIEYKLEKRALDNLDFKTVDEIVERGHAECRGYAVLFTALCRAADVPARTIWGLSKVPAGPGRPEPFWASHNWSEVYIPGAGWVPVDPQKPETLGCLPNSCVRLFMDVRKTKTSPETLPMLNLTYMHADRIKFEESR
jgi:hypothetical protein